MKTKLTLLLLSLLCSVGTWAADVEWNVGSGAGANFTVWALGLELPGTCTSGNIYSLKDFTITYRGDSGTQALYLAISTDNGINTGNDNAGVSYPATKVLAISDSPCSASASSCKYTFTKPVKLCAGVRYYAIFLTNNVPSDGNYTRKKQGIKVQSGTYTPTYINTYNTSTGTDYMPIFTATLTNGIPISTTSGVYSDKTDNGNWAATWTSEGQAPTLKFSTSDKFIKVADGSIWTGGDPANCVYTISVPDGFQITGYSLTGKANLADNDQVITPADDEANPKTFTSTANNTVTISGIAKTSTTFTLSGNNKGVAVSEFIVNVRVNPSIGTMVSTLKTNMETSKAMSGLGYPKADAVERTTLNAAYAVINGYDGSTHDYYKAANYAGQLEGYISYLKCSDIVMPTDGKVYTFTNVQPGDTKYYLKSSGGTMSVDMTEANATPFICHKISDNQFAFISVDDWYWMIAASSKNNSVVQNYDIFAPLTISAFNTKLSSKTSSSDTINTFGLFEIYGERKLENGSAGTGGYAGSVAIVKKHATNPVFDTSSGAYFNTSFSSAYKLTEASDYYNKVNLASDGTDAYASLYLPFSVTIPSGITAYTVTDQDGTYAHLEPIVTNGTLPKNTAAILKKAGQDKDETIYLSPAVDAGSNSTTPYAGFGGTVVTTPRENLGTGSTYVLGKRNSTDSEETVNIGLYNYTGTNLAKGKAYLFVAGGSAKALVFDFGDDDATGIKSLTPALSEGEGAIYNIAGQRMSRMQKGVNIVNGKKILF